MVNHNLNQDRHGFPVFPSISVSFSVSSLPRGDALTPLPTTTTNNLLLLPPPLLRSHYNNRPGRMGRTDGRTDGRITAGQQPNATSYMLWPCYAQTHRRRNDDGDGQRSREGESQPGLRAVSRLESRVSWSAQHYERNQRKCRNCLTFYLENTTGF